MLIHGDMLKVVPEKVAEGSVDLIIYDPPYGIGNKPMAVKSRRWKKTAENWDTFESLDEQYSFYKDTLSLLARCLSEKGTMFVFGSFHNIYLVGEILQRQLKMKVINSIVWNKTNAIFNVTRSALIEGTEHIIWVTLNNGEGHNFNYDYACTQNHGKQLRNVWNSFKTPPSELVGHPHQKPSWLVQRLVRLACLDGGMVLDPMCGTGTTEAICRYEGHKSLCIEKNEVYFQAAKSRVERETDLEELS